MACPSRWVLGGCMPRSPYPPTIHTVSRVPDPAWEYPIPGPCLGRHRVCELRSRNGTWLQLEMAVMVSDIAPAMQWVSQAPKRDGERRQSLLIATPQHCLQRMGRRANCRGSVKVSWRLALSPNFFFITVSQHAQVCQNCRGVCMGAVHMMVVGAEAWVIQEWWRGVEGKERGCWAGRQNGCWLCVLKHMR